jgi:hypothetical protein
MIAIVVVVLLFGACTATQPGVPGILNSGPGFLRGFWHGFIAPVSFLVSLFTDDVRIYAFPNSGRWYDFGFMLGISGFSGGLFAGSRKRTVVVMKDR